MKIKEIEIRKELFKSEYSDKWEECMFGYVIHLPKATIRIYKKKVKLGVIKKGENEI